MFSQACVCPEGGVHGPGGDAWSQGGVSARGGMCMVRGWGVVVHGIFLFYIGDEYHLHVIFKPHPLNQFAEETLNRVRPGLVPNLCRFQVNIYKHLKYLERCYVFGVVLYNCHVVKVINISLDLQFYLFCSIFGCFPYEVTARNAMQQNSFVRGLADT